MNYRELTNEQRRQLLDFMQVDSLLREKNRELETRFSGSMRWLRRSGKDYLHVKRGKTEKSLGERSIETELIHTNFMHGRDQLFDLVKNLKAQVNRMAPVNRALGLGRVPILTAKILRKFEQEGLLGNHLLVAGTNAMWAYEARAGIQLQSDIVATMDADMLWDPRLGIKLLPVNNSKSHILRILQKIDKSFSPRGANDFRAFNKDGFSVDVIRPEDEAFFASHQKSVSGMPGDLEGAPIFGLQWLLNAPRFESRTIAEDGNSVLVQTFDPRAFCFHKLWLSQRKDRDPIKAKRDEAQAIIIAEVSQKFLNLDFEDQDLRALPVKLRKTVFNFRGNRS